MKCINSSASWLRSWCRTKESSITLRVAAMPRQAQRFVVVMLARPRQRMNMREHRGHAEIGEFWLRVRPRVVHQLLFALDPAATQKHVGVQLAVLDFVPNLTRP